MYYDLLQLLNKQLAVVPVDVRMLDMKPCSSPPPKSHHLVWLGLTCAQAIDVEICGIHEKFW